MGDMFVNHFFLSGLAMAHVPWKKIGFEPVVVVIVDGGEDRVAVGIEPVPFVPVCAAEAGADAPDAAEFGRGGADYPAINSSVSFVQVGNLRRSGLPYQLGPMRARGPGVISWVSSRAGGIRGRELRGYRIFHKHPRHL